MRYFVLSIASGVLTVLCGSWLFHCAQEVVFSRSLPFITVDTVVTLLLAVAGAVMGLWYGFTLLAMSWLSQPRLQSTWHTQQLAQQVRRWGAPIARHSSVVILATGLTFSGSSALAQTLDLGWAPTSEQEEINQSTYPARSIAHTRVDNVGHTADAPGGASPIGSPLQIPMPENPPPDHQAEKQEYIVRHGDSLWSIAHHMLDPAHRNNAAVSAYWQQIYQDNFKTIGPSPHVIYPNQRLIIAPYEPQIPKGEPHE